MQQGSITHKFILVQDYSLIHVYYSYEFQSYPLSLVSTWCSDEVEHGLGTVVTLSVFVSTLTTSLTYFLNHCTYLAQLADGRQSLDIVVAHL